MKKFRRIISLLLVLALAVGVFAGCSKKAEEVEPTTQTEATTEAPAETTTAPKQETTTEAPAVNKSSIASSARLKELIKGNSDGSGNSFINFEPAPRSTPADFRIVAYYVANSSANNYNNIDRTHLAQLTDIIVFGIAGFGEDGNVWIDNDFSLRLNNIRKALRASGSKARVHINLLGPGSKSSSSDWNEQMIDQGNRHSKAFASGKLEQNIYNLVSKNGFDGVFFDYEYPVIQEHWNDFDRFLVSLDKKLGNKYIIGAAISPWNTMQTRAGRQVLDMVEVMSYDTWDDAGNHATFAQSKKDILQMRARGYTPTQMDLGVPFYARPTTHEAYWYGYNGYYKQIDENGLCYDKATGLTFSFNTQSVIYEKTSWAINRGIGGMMVWHYACDVDANNSKSLFNSMIEAKNDAQ